MNRKMIGEAIYIRVSDSKKKSDSHETWKCADPELEKQIRCFPYVSRSDVERIQQLYQCR
jgi:hypothetical protein